MIEETTFLVSQASREKLQCHKHHTDQPHRAILQSIAQRAMLERGLLPDFSAAVLAELDRIQAPAGVERGFIDFKGVGPAGD